MQSLIAYLYFNVMALNLVLLLFLVLSLILLLYIIIFYLFFYYYYEKNSDVIIYKGFLDIQKYFRTIFLA